MAMRAPDASTLRSRLRVPERQDELRPFGERQLDPRPARLPQVSTLDEVAAFDPIREREAGSGGRRSPASDSTGR